MFTPILAAAVIGNQNPGFISKEFNQDPTPYVTEMPNPLESYSINVNGKTYSITFPDFKEKESQQFKSILRARNGYEFGIEFGLLSYAEKLDNLLSTKDIQPGSPELSLAQSIDSLFAACELDPDFNTLLKQTKNLQLVFFKAEGDLVKFFGEENWRKLGISPTPCFALNTGAPEEKIKTAIFIQEDFFRSAPSRLFLPFIYEAARAMENEKITRSELTPVADKKSLEVALKTAEKIYELFKKVDPKFLKIFAVDLETMDYQIQVFRRQTN